MNCPSRIVLQAKGPINQPLATQICPFPKKDIFLERKPTKVPPRSKHPVYSQHTHYSPLLTSTNPSQWGFLAAPLSPRRHTAPRPARVEIFLHFHFGHLEPHPSSDTRAQTKQRTLGPFYNRTYQLEVLAEPKHYNPNHNPDTSESDYNTALQALKIPNIRTYAQKLSAASPILYTIPVTTPHKASQLRRPVNFQTSRRDRRSNAAWREKYGYKNPPIFRSKQPRKNKLESMVANTLPATKAPKGGKNLRPSRTNAAATKDLSHIFSKDQRAKVVASLQATEKARTTLLFDGVEGQVQAGADHPTSSVTTPARPPV